MSAKHASDLVNTYAEVAKGYEQRNSLAAMSPQLLSVIEMFSSHLPHKVKLLDLGAGTGRDASIFAELQHEVTLFDISPEMLAIAQKRIPDGDFIIGDMTNLPFKDESFNGVWANCSLLHLTKEEMRSVLRKINSILKNDGLLGVVVKEGVGEQFVDDDKYGTPMSRFFSFYTLEELTELIEAAGFTYLNSGKLPTRSQEVQIFILARKKE